MGEEVIEELPKTIVRRVVKDKLSQCSDEIDLSLHKDALLAFSEAGRVFIHYLSATANELCTESKRQTMNAEDVMKAVEEIEFHEFLGPLRASLEDYRRKNTKKRAGTAKAKEATKKRKDDVPTASENISNTEDGVEECNNNKDTASDQELQHNSDDENHQDNDEDVDRESEGEEDADDQEQQNLAVEEEKSSKESEDDEDNVNNSTRNHEPDADESIAGKEGDNINPPEEE